MQMDMQAHAVATTCINDTLPPEVIEVILSYVICKFRDCAVSAVVCAQWRQYCIRHSKHGLTDMMQAVHPDIAEFMRSVSAVSHCADDADYSNDAAGTGDTMRMSLFINEFSSHIASIGMKISYTIRHRLHVANVSTRGKNVTLNVNHYPFNYFVGNGEDLEKIIEDYSTIGVDARVVVRACVFMRSIAGRGAAVYSRIRRK